MQRPCGWGGEGQSNTGAPAWTQKGQQVWAWQGPLSTLEASGSPDKLSWMWAWGEGHCGETRLGPTPSEPNSQRARAEEAGRGSGPQVDRCPGRASAHPRGARGWHGLLKALLPYF